MIWIKINRSRYKILVCIISFYIMSPKLIHVNSLVVYKSPTEVTQYQKDLPLDSYGRYLTPRKTFTYPVNIFKQVPPVLEPEARLSFKEINLLLIKEFTVISFSLWTSLIENLLHISYVVKDYITYNLESSVEQRQEWLLYNKSLVEEQQKKQEQKRAERMKFIQSSFSSVTQVLKSVWLEYLSSESFLNSFTPNSNSVLTTRRVNIIDIAQSLKTRFFPQGAKFKITIPWFKTSL
jgi:hypothetical protein